MFERNGELVGRKFYSYLAVNILMMMAVSLSSIIDGVISSHLLGMNALAAINACIPFTVLFGALYVIIGVGGSMSAASKLGAGKTREANGIFTLSVILLIALGLLVTVVLSAAEKPLVAYIVKGSNLYDLTREFLHIIILGAVPLFLGPGISYFMTLDGRPELSIALMLIYSGGNIVLDLLFMGPLQMGIRGAAAATVLAAALGLICVVIYFRSGQRTLHFKPGDISLQMILPLIVSGLPSALNSIVLFVRMLVLNKTSLFLLGNTGATIVAVCNNCSTFASIFIAGITTTMLTILAVLHGEEDLQGLKEVFKRALKLTLLASVIMLAVFEGLPGLVVAVFGISGDSLRTMGILAVRLFGLSLPLYALVHIFMSFYQAIGQKSYSICIVVGEGVVFMLPSVFLLSKIGTANGLGLWLSFACAEVVTLIFMAAANSVIAKHSQVKWLLLLKDHNEEIVFDKTIDNDAASAAGLSEQIIAFCTENGISKSKAYRTGLAVEEMAVNTVNYGYKKAAHSTLDIRLIISPEHDITIRIRDSGTPYNPLEYTPAEGDRLGGIYILKEMTKSIDYSRSVGFNNLMIKL